MKTKKLLLACLLLCSSVLLFSKEIDKTTAEKVARNFYFERINLYNQPISFDDLIIQSSKLVDHAYYVFNFQKGWVVVPASDAMVPVLGYSYEGAFPEKVQQSPNFKGWMQHYADQVLFARENRIESEGHKAKWDKYLTYDHYALLITNKAPIQVGPLLTCVWHQNYPYNIFCPEDPVGPGGYVLAGCGATAIAMIMHYWRYPVHGSGSKYYYCYPYGDIFVNFEEATYEWDAMQDSIDFEYPWEIAEITYHAGVSVQMNYGPDISTSSTWKVPYAIYNYFIYDQSIDTNYKANYDQEVWEDMIREDLDLGRPLDYRGAKPDVGGHLFVCDGYQLNPDLFHFNFGWSGNQNGFYTLEDLNGWNEGQWMVKNIFPADTNYPYIAEGHDTLRYILGSFTDGSGPVEDYPSGMDVSWLIDPQSENDSVEYITLTFVRFNTAAADFLRVYDGESTSDELLGEFSGDDLPEDITSTGNKMLVTFSSTGTGKGFLIEYDAVAPIYCETQQYFTEPSGTITDGSGTFHYNNSTTCMYILQHPEAQKYTLEFTNFATEEGEDLLKIYDGDQNLIGHFSGHEIPEMMEVETDMIGMIWSTNEMIKDEGWSFDYWVGGTGIDETDGMNNFIITPNPCKDFMNLRFTIYHAGIVTLNLFEISGLKLESILNKSMLPGTHSMEIDLRDLQPGAYFIIFNTWDDIQTKKIIKF